MLSVPILIPADARTASRNAREAGPPQNDLTPQE